MMKSTSVCVAKVAIVRKEASQAPTLFLGDGINDAPAMQAATVGVAFGVQSDIKRCARCLTHGFADRFLTCNSFTHSG